MLAVTSLTALTACGVQLSISFATSFCSNLQRMIILLVKLTEPLISHIVVSWYLLSFRLHRTRLGMLQFDVVPLERSGTNVSTRFH